MFLLAVFLCWLCSSTSVCASGCGVIVFIGWIFSSCFLFPLWSSGLCGLRWSRGSPPELEARLLVAKEYITGALHQLA